MASLRSQVARIRDLIEDAPVPITLTPAEMNALRALKGKKSDRRRAASMGVGVEDARKIIWGLRDKLNVRPGEMILAAAARQGIKVG